MIFLEFDVLFEGGVVIDGAGNPWFKADVGLVGDRIAAVGFLKGSKAGRRVNAKGLVVSPGFIDPHSHSDFPVLVDPRAESKVYQGVTTEVVGNCGSSAAPMNEAVKTYREKYARSGVGDDFVFDCYTMADYLARIGWQGAGLNVAAFLGHGTIRQNVMGYENREPTDTELRKMKRLTDEGMRDGAFGISSGLIYPPSVYAKTPELVELAKVSARHHGLYLSHIRGEDHEKLVNAVNEAIQIGEESGAPVHIAHFKASGQEAWGLTEKTLRIVEEARARGTDVTFDQYPYIASSTGLTAVLPHWAQEGGADKLMERLRDKKLREKMLREQQLGRNWEDIMVITAKNHPEHEGKRITEIAKEQGKKPGDAALDLLLASETQVPTVMFGLSEEDVRRVMQSPNGMAGSDGSAISPRGVLGKGKPHPRAYGTFVRVLGHYVREGVIPLQHAVRRMTSFPAQRLGLLDRGILRPGFKADVIAFDSAKVKDEATFTDPHRFPTGLPYVLVNGEFVIDKGKHTGKLPGKPLKRPN